MIDTSEYRSLLERFSRDTALYEQKGSNETASFLFYTLGSPHSGKVADAGFFRKHNNGLFRCFG